MFLLAFVLDADLLFCSRMSGHARGTNMVFVSDNSEETWRKLDKKVNKYPGEPHSRLCEVHTWQLGLVVAIQE